MNTELVMLNGPQIGPAPVSPASGKPNLKRLLEILTGQGLPLYCLLDAAVDTGIERELLKAEIDPLPHSLYSGESAVTLGFWAPYLVPLSPVSPLLPVLLERGWGKAWASYFTSDASFDDLRRHFRKFLMVQVEGRGEMYFRFYDPRVLQVFLPTADSQELVTFFGPVQEWFLEGKSNGNLLHVSNSPSGLLSSVLTFG